ncbi:hypothetical protein MferCBS31731_002874 [Microsporum ferrugineum]
MEPQEQQYQHSLAQSQAGGGVSVRSRSSSIVSTRTGVTIATLQDDTRSVRSMELVVGRRIFSINRDGSRITEHSGLPPYTSAPPEYSSLDRVAGNAAVAELPAPNIPNYEEVAWPSGESEYRQLLQPIPSVRLDQRCDTPVFPVGEPARAELPATPAEGERRGSGSVARTHSFVPGPEKISVVAKRRSVSESNIQANLHPNSNSNILRNNNPLRRRNGIRLPQLDTGVSFGQLRNAFSSNAGPPSASPRMTHSAGPSIGGSSNDFLTGNIYYNGATIGESGNVSRGRSPPTTPRATRSPLLAVLQGPPVVEEGYADTELPPAMDTENEISIHFSRMIRSIDREHRRVLHQKCRELADLRERLNEVDQVYRKELRSRDFIIDELRQEISLMEFRMDEKVERARNEVEDIWEKRWKDQEKLLLNMQRRQSQADLSRMIGRRRAVGRALSSSQGLMMHEDEENDDDVH